MVDFQDQNGSIKRIKSRNRYYKNRRQCIDKLGGKCVECGVTENLQFDHINPLEKSFAISESLHFSPKMKKEVKFDEELNKCQLLCPTCHMKKTKNDWLSGNLYVGISKERIDT